ncbi:class I SAM-dependent methyltransferase [Streptomyces sp. ventii]|uniref:Class I SAM-dependent methyltransferase n=1 Tax=Streptomyces spiramenti TaxID=2720606 RepID=A0ABX1AT51_9ACTN|nr:class I SAM-dependent methyltransferase [Streptomyces spiramenti]NJP67415.1 class I SAM-dependent methyltransferase [Streptomyces spiramenti]
MLGTTGIDWNRTYESGQYAHFWEIAHPSQELVGFLAARPAGDGRTAVDLGCGTGSDVIELARQGYRATGFDLSPAAVRIATGRAREQQVQAEYRVADVLALPLADGSVDLVVDRGCFHHLGDEDRARYAAEVGRVLRPGGELLLRGVRYTTFPFKAVTAASLAAVFPPVGLVVDRVVPALLTTDATSLEKNVCLLHKAGADADAAATGAAGGGS